MTGTNKKDLKGIFVVMPTPLTADEGLDREGLNHLIDYYIDCRCHGLLVLGSGGEFPYFNFEEKLDFIRMAADAVRGRVPLIAGAGFFSLAETAKFIDAAGELEIDGFLVILPTYYPVNFDQVFDFYSFLCKHSKKPILYYNYPQQTGLFFSPAQIARLLMIDGMAGIKDSILSLKEIHKHIDLSKDKGPAVFSGNSFFLEQIIRMGGCGTICVIPSVAPRLVVDCYEACMDHNDQKAKAYQEKILDLLPLMNTFGLPATLQKLGFKAVSTLSIPMKNPNNSRTAVIKETLRQLGHPVTARVKSPQPQVSEKEKKAIRDLIRKNNLSI